MVVLIACRLLLNGAALLPEFSHGPIGEKPYPVVRVRLQRRHQRICDFTAIGERFEQLEIPHRHLPPPVTQSLDGR